MLDQPRSTQRYPLRRVDNEPRLLREMRALARQRPRFGAKRIVRVLGERHWKVNHKRVHRLWKRENNIAADVFQAAARIAACVVGHSTRTHVWSYDFLTDRTEDSRQLRLLVVIDETTRECWAIEVARWFTAQDVIGVLQYLFAVRGTPQQIRSDNGPEFVAKTVRRWLQRADVGTLFIAKGSPWENDYVRVDGRQAS